MKNSGKTTMMIKSKFSNQVHKLLEPNINLKTRERWAVVRKSTPLTNEQKLELFDKIVALHNDTSSELTSYQYQRRSTKRRDKIRAANGYVSKNKTTLKNWIAKQNSLTPAI